MWGSAVPGLIEVYTRSSLVASRFMHWLHDTSSKTQPRLGRIRIAHSVLCVPCFSSGYHSATVRKYETSYQIILARKNTRIIIAIIVFKKLFTILIHNVRCVNTTHDKWTCHWTPQQFTQNNATTGKIESTSVYWIQATGKTSAIPDYYT
jgi:hypothetical protein